MQSITSFLTPVHFLMSIKVLLSSLSFLFTPHNISLKSTNTNVKIRSTNFPTRIHIDRSAFNSLHHRQWSLTASMLPANPLAQDACAAVITAGAALGLLRFFEELAKRQVFDQKLNRKLVHVCVGLAFMLFWPLFSSEWQAPLLAALAPGINIFRMLFMGLGITKNETMVRSISRHGDYRELLKGPLYYACTITLATSVFWRTTPIGMAAVCNLCAGDGLADIIGRRFGKHKLAYNPDKSIEGSVAMALAGFVASILYMHYFAVFGFMEESWGVVMGFFLLSLASAVVESLPISSKLDDNLTVPLTSLFLGCFVFL